MNCYIYKFGNKKEEKEKLKLIKYNNVCKAAPGYAGSAKDMSYITVHTYHTQYIKQTVTLHGMISIFYDVRSRVAKNPILPYSRISPANIALKSA